jgi:hypothetical protein
MVVEDIETRITYLSGTTSTNTCTYSNTKVKVNYEEGFNEDSEQEIERNSLLNDNWTLTKKNKVKVNYEEGFNEDLEQEIKRNSLLNDNWTSAKEKYPVDDDNTHAVIYSYTSSNGFYCKLNEDLRQWCNDQRMKNFLYLNVVLEKNKNQDGFETCITLHKAKEFKKKLVKSCNMAGRNIELYFLNVTKTECANTSLIKISGDVAIIWKFPNFKTEIKFDYQSFDLNVLPTVISNLTQYLAAK